MEMDQYLPGEGDQAVMVLRFLAASGCEEAVMAMIKEKPFIKHFIPSQPPNLSRTDYVKRLAAIRPFRSLNLDDLLSDYAKTQWMLTQLIQKMNPGGSPLRALDSLVTLLKQLEDILNKRSQIHEPVPAARLCLLPQEAVKVDVGVNTDDEVFPPIPNVEISTNKSSLSAETQTDFFTSDGEERDLPNQGLPLMFYNSLISDTSMPQKLATAINEHFADTATKNEGLPPKVFTQVESEIDRFMLDLLHDGDSENSCSSLPSVLQNNSNGTQNSGTIQPPNFYEGLSNLFGDADSFINKDGLQTSINCTKEGKESIIAATEAPPISISPASAEAKINSDSKNSKAMTLPPQSVRNAPVKRIIPKRAPTCTPRPNPVFELNGEDPLLTMTEKRVIPQHPYKHPYTVIEARPISNNASSWGMLGRKSIEPKLPTGTIHSTSPTQPASLPKEIAISSPEKLIKPAKLESKLKNSKKPQGIATAFGSKTNSNKRKARLLPPTKLTPEKAIAKQHGANFFCPHDSKILSTTPTKAVIHSEAVFTPHHEQLSQTAPPPPASFQGPKLILVTEPISPANPSSSASSSMCKQMSSQSFAPCQFQTPAADKLDDNNLIKLISQSEVTPILDAFESNLESLALNNAAIDSRADTKIKVKSPKLRGLIASAQKFKATTTQTNLYRKSFSTPRKKHVRNLLFDTPPSLKEVNSNTNQRLPSLSSPPSSSAVPVEITAKLITRSSSNSEVSVVSKTDVHPLPRPPTYSSRKRKASSESPDKHATNSIGQQSISNNKRRKWTEEDYYRSFAFPDRNFYSMQMKENMSQTANKILNVAQNPTSTVPIVSSSPPKLTCTSIPTNNGALPLPPIQEELGSIHPPSPTVVVEVVTSPVLEDGEIEDSQSPINDVDVEVEEPCPVKVCKSKHPPTVTEPERFGTEKVSKPIKETKRRSSAKEKPSKTKKTTVDSSTRRQTLSYELFGTDVEDTPVKAKKRDTPVKAKKHDAPPVKTKKHNMPVKTKKHDAPPVKAKKHDTPVKTKKHTAPVKAKPAKVKVPAVKVSPVKSKGNPHLGKGKDGDPALHPFHIIPAPIGFPDPTPVKNDPMVSDVNQDSNSRSHFSTLITPMKSSLSHNISPPMLSLPPTPRYILNDPDAMDSNSNSNFTMFRSADYLHTPLNTPFKLGPPPTPGRTIILDRSLGAIPITMMSQQHHPHPLVQPTSSSVCCGDFSSIPTVLSDAIPSHVLISRNTPRVTVSSLSNSQSSISTSTIILPPPRAENKRQQMVQPGRRKPLQQKILSRPASTLPNPSAPVVVPSPSGVRKKVSKADNYGVNMEGSGNNGTNKSRTPFDPIAPKDVEVNGYHTILLMTKEKKILAPNETDFKASDDTVDPNNIRGFQPKPVPTTSLTGFLKKFNVNRFLQTK